MFNAGGSPLLTHLLHKLAYYALAVRTLLNRDYLHKGILFGGTRTFLYNGRYLFISFEVFLTVSEWNEIVFLEVYWRCYRKTRFLLVCRTWSCGTWKAKDKIIRIRSLRWSHNQRFEPVNFLLRYSFLF